MLKVGQIPYLNCEPFFHGLALDDVELCPMAPSAMGPLARAGKLDAAPFSLVQGLGLRDQYETLGDMGISVKGPVRSILFYCRVPMTELSGRLVGATHESATSVQLMKVILEQRYHVLPSAYTNLDASELDALLLIGDDALTTHDSVDGFSYRYDLAEEWLEWKGLPFVFAIWMVRRTLDADVKGMLADGLRKNLVANMANSLQTIADERENMGLGFDGVTGYLRAFRYFLDQEDYRAMEEFEGALRSLPSSRGAIA